MIFIKPNYTEYLRSDEWYVRKGWLKKRVGRMCERCGIQDGRYVKGKQVFLDVHHKHYRTLGKEQPEDVEILCRPCHKSQHKGWR